MQRVSRTDLFLGFMKIGMLGFGGIAPWVRRVIVEERGWLDDAEYAALLGVGRVLPGPNTMNASVMIGDHYQGALGALLCLLRLMTVLLTMLVALASMYRTFAGVQVVSAAVGGAAASAAGLVIGTALRILLNTRQSWSMWPFAAVMLGCIGLRLPLIPVVLVTVPLSIAAAARAHS